MKDILIAVLKLGCVGSFFATIVYVVVTVLQAVQPLMSVLGG